MIEYNLWWKVVTNISLRYLLLATITFVVCYFLLRKPLSKRKIQQAFPRMNDYARDIVFSLFSIIIFSSIAYLCIGVLKTKNHFLYGSMGQVSVWYHIGSFIWLFFLHDAYFYWIHRMMHLPRLFKLIHLVHHRSTNPSPWTAYSFHPIEAVLEAGIIPLAAFLLPVHVGLFSLFMLFQIVYNIYGHLGYEFWPRSLASHSLGKWINTGVAHNQHHKMFKGNYGLYTLIWDRLFGTLRNDYSTAMQTYGK
jgi:sterol desaturase/sphingolipid hydroxylase (fatty acid hydroxylase superfamily)